MFWLVQSQVIVAPNGQILHFSIPALSTLMDWYDVDDRKDCFEKVELLWREIHV